MCIRDRHVSVGFHRDVGVFGCCLYSGKRLIQAFERIGVQNGFDSRGNAVVLVVQIPRGFLNPDHSKTKFEHSQQLTLLTRKLEEILSLFWHKHRPDKNVATRWHFLACSQCQQLRRVPPSEKGKSHPGFRCSANKWDARCAREGCSMPQEMSTEKIHQVMNATSSMFRAMQRKHGTEDTIAPAPAAPAAKRPKRLRRTELRKLGWCVAPGCTEPHTEHEVMHCSECGDYLHASCQYPPAEFPGADDWRCPDCDDTCSLCSRGGTLIQCESCPLWFHWPCFIEQEGMQDEQQPGEDESFYCTSCRHKHDARESRAAAVKQLSSRKRKPVRKPAAACCARCVDLEAENKQLRAQLSAAIYEPAQPGSQLVQPGSQPMQAVAAPPVAEPEPRAVEPEQPRAAVKAEPEPEVVVPLLKAEPNMEVPAVKHEPGTEQFSWSACDRRRMETMCKDLFPSNPEQYLTLFRRGQVAFDDLLSLQLDEWRELGVLVGPRCRIAAYLGKMNDVIEL
eukprot:TRINITY_DN13797_c0_g1_i1.p1 TRINITY_DN13797_c0_g1~~TRINITY_DN13797_c0_g1_i1.p1  ORF type:complete len:507 (+),score=144.76 TRINITY_DN13797_c0_g1_i1:84-1604(+)